jgi:hypothetical protein
MRLSLVYLTMNAEKEEHIVLFLILLFSALRTFSLYNHNGLRGLINDLFPPLLETLC